MAKIMKKFNVFAPTNVEHKITRDTAISYVASRLVMVPKGSGQQLSQDLLALSFPFVEGRDVDAKLRKDPHRYATVLAERLIDGIMGNDNRFQFVTVEALSAINKDLFVEIVRAEDSRRDDILDQTVQGLPTRNGKTLTTSNIIRIANVMATDFDAYTNFAKQLRVPNEEHKVFVKNEMDVDFLKATGQLKSFKVDVATRMPKEVVALLNDAGEMLAEPTIDDARTVSETARQLLNDTPTAGAYTSNPSLDAAIANADKLVGLRL